MSPSASGYHEPFEILSPETRDRHRALLTVIEELEAVDWYEQRAAACTDPELKKIILHHREEEIEHALMALEWLRRRCPDFAEHAKTYLFSEGPITDVEEAAKAGEAESPEGDPSTSSLGIGKPKRS